MAAMKRIVVDLDGGEYQRLRDRALDQDRDPHQQARHLLRQALAVPSEVTTATAGVVRPPEQEWPGAAMAFYEGGETVRRIIASLEAPVAAAAVALVSTLDLAPRTRKELSDAEGE